MKIKGKGKARPVAFIGDVYENNYGAILLRVSEKNSIVLRTFSNDPFSAFSRACGETILVGYSDADVRKVYGTLDYVDGITVK